MKFTNECPVHLIELTQDNACLVKVPPSWMSKGQKDICYFITEDALLQTRECSITRRDAYYFSIRLSSLSTPLLRNLISNTSEPYDLIADNQTLLQRTENFPWQLRRFPNHEHIVRSSTHPIMHACSSSVVFAGVGLLTVLMLQSTLREDIFVNNHVGLFAFVLLLAMTGGATEYCLRTVNYNSSGLFNEGLKLLRSIPPSSEPHRHATTQQL